jgi:uncharacterized OB-fold protein
MAASSLTESEMYELNGSQDNEETMVATPKPAYLRSSKKKKTPGRKCKICGKNPHPNYFFCPSCHHRISAVEEIDMSFPGFEQ